MPSAYLQWWFHSGERVVARGPLVLLLYLWHDVNMALRRRGTPPMEITVDLAPFLSVWKGKRGGCGAILKERIWPTVCHSSSTY